MEYKVLLSELDRVLLMEATNRQFKDYLRLVDRRRSTASKRKAGEKAYQYRSLYLMLQQRMDRRFQHPEEGK